MLDFYGTLVHEDDDLIPLMCEEVRRGVPSMSTSSGILGSGPTASEIGRYWWDLLHARYAASWGNTFVDQRTLGLQTLSETAAAFGSTSNATAIIQRQFDRWVAPPIFPETRTFLDDVRELGLPICVVSNIDRGDIEAAIAFHRLQFDHLITSDDVRAYKPRSEMFVAALHVLGLRHDEVLHIGDSRTSDIGGARAMDIPVAWVNRTEKPVDGGPVADHTVMTLEDLLPIIRL